MPGDEGPAVDDATPTATDEAPTEPFDFGDTPETSHAQPSSESDVRFEAEAEPEPGALPEPEPETPPAADDARSHEPEAAAPQTHAPESMTDQESGRAEAEASAEAAIDDGRDAIPPGEDVDRDPTLDLASLHLRLGSLALARSELETFAGRGVLDAAARIDLAEVRWRTGDLVGGGEAAREALAGGGEAVVALVVASEAASALGRPSEARRLAGRAMSLHGGPIDGIFAGMPRSSVWPADPSEPVPSPSTLFPPERSDLAMDAERDEAAVAAADDEAAGAVAAAVVAPTERVEPGLWDLHEAAALAAAAVEPAPGDLDPSALFDAGRAALENGDRSSAAVHLGLVVRMAPALAPAVLSLIGEPSDSGLQLVQGDAYRAVGHETEARRCYAAAIASASTPSTPSTVEWFGPSTTEPRAAAWWLESLDESRPAAAWPPAAPPAPTEPDTAPAQPEPHAEATEPEPDAEAAEPDPIEPEAAPAEPDRSSESGSEPEAEPAEPQPSTDASEAPASEPPASVPPAADPDRGWRDDEGGWRVEDEEWRSGG